MKNTKAGNVIFSEADHGRLTALIDQGGATAYALEDNHSPLEVELNRARVLPPGKVPPDVVTMDSTVRLRDLSSGRAVTYTLVFPRDADVTENRISVLAPVGTAILGCREGDTVEVRAPAGLRRLKIEEVVYQPERASRG